MQSPVIFFWWILLQPHFSLDCKELNVLETPYDVKKKKEVTENLDNADGVVGILDEMPTEKTAETVCTQILLFFVPTASLISCILIALLVSEVSISIVMKRIESTFNWYNMKCDVNFSSFIQFWNNFHLYKITLLAFVLNFFHDMSVNKLVRFKVVKNVIV